jgi:hypothetical protein
MRKLQYKDRRYTAFIACGSFYFGYKSAEGFRIIPCEHHLADVRSSLGANRTSLKPDKSRTASCRLHVFRYGKLVGASVLMAVTALHRLKNHSVWNNVFPDTEAAVNDILHKKYLRSLFTYIIADNFPFDKYFYPKNFIFRKKCAPKDAF